MKELLCAFILTNIICLMLRYLVIRMKMIVEKKTRCSVNDKALNFLFSIVCFLIWICIWLLSVNYLLNNCGGMKIIVQYYYMGFIVTGIMCTVWCYFAWDMDDVKSRPRRRTEMEMRYRKIVVYVLLGVFSLFLGYHQTMRVFDDGYQVPMLFSTTNSSVVVAIIALDRIMNQLFKGKETTEAQNKEQEGGIKREKDDCMTEKERIAKYIRVMQGKEKEDFSQWEEQQKEELKKLPANVLHNRKKDYEAKLTVKDFMIKKGNADVFIGNIITVLVAYLSGIITVVIAWSQNFNSLMSSLREELEGIENVLEFTELV